MRRREFITLISGAAALPAVARAQRPEQIRRIGVLTQGSINSHPTPPFRAFLNTLHEAGWHEGNNLKIEWRFSEGSAESLPRLANELVGLQVELIITAPTEPTLAAKRATSIIPIVFVQVADPVRSGIVTNLARPDANVTGMSALATDIAGKRLALIKEALPNTKLVSVLWNRPSKGAALILDELLIAGRRLGIELQDIGVDKAAEIEAALRIAADKGSSPHSSDRRSGSAGSHGNSNPHSGRPEVTACFSIGSVRKKWRPHGIRTRLERTPSARR